jgi:hypothetical protein
VFYTLLFRVETAATSRQSLEYDWLAAIWDGRTRRAALQTKPANTGTVGIMTCPRFWTACGA